MNPGDLVRIRAGLVGAGDIGVLVGPSKVYSAAGYFDVLFSDGIAAVPPKSLTRVRKAKGVINEAR